VSKFWFEGNHFGSEVKRCKNVGFSGQSCSVFGPKVSKFVKILVFPVEIVQFWSKKKCQNFGLKVTILVLR